MAAASRHVYEVNEQIQAQLNALMDRLEPLTSSWRGGAATSFMSLRQRWLDDATRLNEALRAIGDGLARTHAGYQGADAGAAADLGAIGRNLGGQG
jgi:WXG100 family type VII secretion target